MLILAYTNGFGVDLYQLSQRILYSSGNGSCTSLSHIKVREFLCGKLTCRIYRSTCLVGDHILYLLLWNLLEHIYDHLLRFTAGSSITYRNQGNPIFIDHFLYRVLGSTDLLLCGRRCRIYHCGIQNLSGCIYNSQLAACTECRVPAQHNFPCNWRLHEKLLQIFSIYMDSTILCLVCKVTADFSLNCRTNKTLIAVLCHFLQNRGSIRIITGDHSFVQIAENILLRCVHLYSDKFFLFSSV